MSACLGRDSGGVCIEDAAMLSVDHTFARRAERLLAVGKLEPADELLQAGLKQWPEYATGYQVLGDLYQQKGNAVSATFAYFESLQRDPENALTLMKLGDIFRASGQEAEARKYFQDALKLDPDSRELLVRLGKVDGNLQAAGKGFFFTETAADLYRQQGHGDKARTIYEHLLRQAPSEQRLKEKLQDCEG